MKYLLSLIALVAAMASAAPAEELLSRSSINGIHQGTPFCAGRDHCVYLGRHASTYLIDPKSIGANKGVVCESYDDNGRGRGACQFPNKVSTTIECDHTGDIAYVDFRCHKSSAKFHQRTKMTMIWSSQKRQGAEPSTVDIETTSVGDDLYIKCHAGHHHHSDNNNDDNNNNGDNGNSNYGQGSGSGDQNQGSTTYNVGGHIEGHAEGAINWDKGLPNTNIYGSH